MTTNLQKILRQAFTITSLPETFQVLLTVLFEDVCGYSFFMLSKKGVAFVFTLSLTNIWKLASPLPWASNTSCSTEDDASMPVDIEV